MSTSGIKSTLKAGAAVFGASSLLLMLAPEIFIQLLGLNTSPALTWSMRMIGVTVLALAGNLWINSSQSEPRRIRSAAVLMAVSAFLLGVMTLLIPAKPSLFTIAYAGVGFGFSGMYVFNLLRAKK